jgi:hypothetical protein
MAWRRDAGQSTVEWIGLVLLVSMLVLAVGALAGSRLPGFALARTVADRLICAAGLGGESCGALPGSELAETYGPELAEIVRSSAPMIAYEEGMHAVPIDFRTCRRDPCSIGAGSGEVLTTQAGEPASLFVHVIDCRSGGAPDSGSRGYDCSGQRAGNLYLQFWAYYPGSQSLRGVPGDPGFHEDDWESFQVRIGPDGADSRASSHHGYNYEGGAQNWPSDAGLTHRAAWGPSTGTYYVSGGSHAGHASEPGEQPLRWTPARGLRLIPIEDVARGRFGSTRFAVTPPWLKQVYRDPEYEGTD